MVGYWCVVVVVVVVVVKGETPMETGEEMTLKREMSKETTLRKEMRGGEEEDALPVLSLSPKEINLQVGKNKTLQVSLSHPPQQCQQVNLTLSHPVVEVTPLEVTLCNGTSATITITAVCKGTATLTALPLTPECVGQTAGGAFSVVSVMGSRAVSVGGDVLGWLYTLAWDFSFLPQLLHNWRRKSVVGLSFDFLTFNLFGFFSYFIFNMGLYWLHDIQDQYALRNPQSILHVRLNDVVFPLYALVCVCLQIAQCLAYKRAEGQRVSTACRVVTGLLVAGAVVGCVLVPLVQAWWWLDLLYLLSYVKLIITCIKYVPQLFVNYKAQSTEGWSIYQVMLDFTGGTLSLVQMFLLSYNYDDWRSLLTDPAKLGLGLLAILFNILFFIQHYCLYRDTSSSGDKALKGIDNPLEVQDAPSQTSGL